ncbi:MFS transporter [Corynebacterium canis]|uniref:MFS transporter n=1 Tax=Corynebacterium canis TaxID=679663 RepID=A0A5C5UT59_9CORY|nr:MFS transporter [Corynebacterium canis]TWT28710.1 MFS transporter [Corynebacterium canis]WJY75716.1 Antiseptic resistance protein [Corynebacterium canis]
MSPSSKPSPTTSNSYPQRWWGLTVLCVAVAVLAIDTTVLNFAIPAINSSLQPSATQTLWIVDVYAFVLAALLVTMGTLGDRIGRRRVLLIGAACFGVASVIAGVSTSAEMLIAGRALQGAAGATLMPSTLSLIRTMFQNPGERGRAISIWVSVYSMGAAAGPLLGGFLLQFFHWGAVFFINVPLVIVMILGGVKYLPSSRSAEPQPFDLTGAMLSILALFSLVYAVKVIPVEGPSLIGLATGLVAVVAGFLLLRHLRLASHPLIDISLMSNPVYATMVTVNGLSMFLYVGVLFYLSQYLQVVLGFPAITAGALMVPGLLMSMLAALVTGRVMSRYPARTLLIIALSITVVASCLLGLDAYGALEHSAFWLAFAFAVFGTGVGMVDPVSNDYIIAAAPPDRVGAAASISETGYELGGAFGTAILGSILMAVYGSGVPEAIGDSVSAAHATGDASLIALADAAFRNGVVASSAVAAATAIVIAIVVARFVPRDVALV